MADTPLRPDWLAEAGGFERFGIRSAAVDHSLGLPLGMRSGRQTSIEMRMFESCRPGLRVFANFDSAMQILPTRGHHPAVFSYRAITSVADAAQRRQSQSINAASPS